MDFEGEELKKGHNQKFGFTQWIGLRRTPDFSKARWLGGLVGVTIGLVAISLAIATLATLYHFLSEVLRTGANHEAIRNIGLVVVAVFGAPFLVWRSVVAQQQATTARESHITDQINKAVEGLGAEKTVSRQRSNRKGILLYEDGPSGVPDFKKPIFETLSTPNIEVRIGAIHALERIARDSSRDQTQILRILCSYLRMNFPAHRAVQPQESNDGAEVLASIPWPSEEVNILLHAIGPLATLTSGNRSTTDIWLNLRETNLQKCDFRDLSFSGCRFERSNLSFGRFYRSNLSGCNFSESIIENATFFDCDLSGCWNLTSKQISSAHMDDKSRATIGNTPKSNTATNVHYRNWVAWLGN